MLAVGVEGGWHPYDLAASDNEQRRASAESFGGREMSAIDGLAWHHARGFPEDCVSFVATTCVPSAGYRTVTTA